MVLLLNASRFVNIQLTEKWIQSVSKMTLNVSLHGFDVLHV